MPAGKSGADISEAVLFLKTLEGLQVTMNTGHHLQVASRAAFSILSDQFDMETASYAGANPEQLHHVYEPQNIGNPLMQLWTNRLHGRGGNRMVTWQWRASRQLIDPLISPTGKYKFEGAGDKFDPTKLRKIHVFVWKAPIMEYGTQVTVRPELSPRKLLVFPNKNNATSGYGSRVAGVTFTPDFQIVRPGKEEGTVGNFTTWFRTWWGEGPAQRIIEGEFDPIRDRAFVAAFHRRLGPALSRPTSKHFTMAVNAQAAKEGAKMAEVLSGDMERRYIEMARRRRRGEEVEIEDE